MRKLSGLENAVMDFCAETCSTAKTYILLEQHRMFLRYGANLEQLTAAKADLVLAALRRLLKSKSKISGCGEMKAALKFFNDERAALLLKKGSV